MAKAPANGAAKARALVDLDDGFIKCGEFFTAEDDLIAALVKEGRACDQQPEDAVYKDVKAPAAKVWGERPKAGNA